MMRWPWGQGLREEVAVVDSPFYFTRQGGGTLPFHV